MQIVNLYRYERPEGGVTVSTEKPDVPYVVRYRLVADEDKVLFDGQTQTTCVDIDVDSLHRWFEVDAPKQEQENEQM